MWEQDYTNCDEFVVAAAAAISEPTVFLLPPPVLSLDVSNNNNNYEGDPDEQSTRQIYEKGVGKKLKYKVDEKKRQGGQCVGKKEVERERRLRSMSARYEVCVGNGCDEGWKEGRKEDRERLEREGGRKTEKDRKRRV